MDVQHQGGHERLLGFRVVLGEVGRVPVRGISQVRHDAGQRKVPVGGPPEGAHQARGLPDGRQALAADVADDQAGRARRGHRRVQVTADLRFGLIRDVRGGDAQRSDPVGKGPHQDLLRREGYRPHLAQRSLVPVERIAKECQERGDHDEGGDLRLVVRCLGQYRRAAGR